VSAYSNRLCAIISLMCVEIYLEISLVLVDRKMFYIGRSL